MNYSIGQLETLVAFAKSRNMRFVNTECPPPETCKRIRNKPHLGWCTLLRGPCVYTDKGCLRMEVRDNRKGGAK